MFATFGLIIAVLCLAGAFEDDDGVGDVLVHHHQQPDDRYKFLYRRCHGYLERVHYVGLTRIARNRLEISTDEMQSAMTAALTAAEPFFDGHSNQVVSDLAKRCGFEHLQHNINEYIAESAQSSGDPKLIELVNGHRSWRVITNIVSDTLAQILRHHPSRMIYINRAKMIMYFVGRDAFVVHLLARSDPKSSKFNGVGENDPVLAIRSLRDRGIFPILTGLFEEQFPKVLKTRDLGDCFTIIPAMMETLARVWWSGVIRPKRQRPTFEQFVLGCGLYVAANVLDQDQQTAPFLHSDLAPDTFEFDQVFDQFLFDIQAVLDGHLPDDLPDREHLVAMILEVFSDLDRPRYLLEWLSAPGDHRDQVLNGAKKDMMSSIGTRLERLEI